MKEYYLFLNESKPNTNFQNFTLGGVTIEKKDYETKLKSVVNKLKMDCFGNNQVILHEIEIRKKKEIFLGLQRSSKNFFLESLKSCF